MLFNLVKLGALSIAITAATMSIQSCSTEPKSECKIDGFCNEGAQYCCDPDNLDTILRCVDGNYIRDHECSGGLDVCIPGEAECKCTGDVECMGTNTERRCFNSRSGIEIHELACNPGGECKVGVGCMDCTSGFDLCKEDTFSCGQDAQTVYACQRIGPDHCAQMVAVMSCDIAGFSICNEPDDPAISATTASQYCANECGGRGVPLDHAVCDPSQSLPCGVYICDGSSSVVNDHISCLHGGDSCSTDAECKSCKCVNGTCEGDFDGLCPAASACYAH